MIALVAASAIYLTGLQAAINAPRDEFRACLKQTGAKATSEKVAADVYETYLRAACSGQLSSLRSALIGFSMKNGMARKQASSDADMTVDDYISSSVDHYKFMADVNGPPKPATAAPAPAAQATPAAAPQQTKPQGQ
jgi:hypothetical protein